MSLLPPLSVCRPPGAQIKGMHHHLNCSLFGTCSVPDWPGTQRPACLILLGLKEYTTLPEPKVFMAITAQDLDPRCTLYFWVVVHSRCSQADNQGWPSHLPRLHMKKLSPRASGATNDWPTEARTSQCFSFVLTVSNKPTCSGMELPV